MSSKWALLSKTIIGIIISVAGAFGFSDLLPADFATQFGNLVDQVMVVGGALLGAYGRYAAKDDITILPKAK
jgi:hypothetical protein